MLVLKPRRTRKKFEICVGRKKKVFLVSAKKKKKCQPAGISTPSVITKLFCLFIYIYIIIIIANKQTASET